MDDDYVMFAEIDDGLQHFDDLCPVVNNTLRRQYFN